MRRITVLVSGGGTNLQALIDAQQRGELGNGILSCVISSKPEVYALKRAINANIPAVVVERKQYADVAAYQNALHEKIEQSAPDIIVLAGFLSVLADTTVQQYKNRIVNVHPALIPAFSGKGYYGLRVHEAALTRGVKVTGATVHLVNDEIDGGPILLQKAVEVLPEDTPQSLQKRVMEQAEWELLPKAVRMLCDTE